MKLSLCIVLKENFFKNCMTFTSLKAIKRIWNKISSHQFTLFCIRHLRRNKQVVWDIDEPPNNLSFHQDPNWVSKAAWDMPSYFCSSAIQSWKVFHVPQQGHRANSLSLECLSLRNKKQTGRNIWQNLESRILDSNYLFRGSFEWLVWTNKFA